MGANTKIEWCDDTFNPWVGCARVGPGCDNCYAESWARRTGQADLWDGARRLTKTWGNPVKWDREARAAGVRRRVFCASLADVFDNAVPDAWREELWHLIARTQQLDWILVTMRIGNAAKMLPPDWGRGWPNVWLLATVCTQGEADRDIPKLLATPAAVRGISYEPALGALDLLTKGWLIPEYHARVVPGDQANRIVLLDVIKAAARHGHRWAGLDWVICGGESGAKARPIHPDWARSARDQCRAAGVAFFFKQWGEWLPSDQAGKICRVTAEPGILSRDGTWRQPQAVADPPEHTFMLRCGKKAAGHVLDGREWLQFPPGAVG